MSNTTVIPLRQPETIDDPLTQVLRSGARELLAKAVEAEVEEFLTTYADLRTDDGLQRVVRHGHGPEREIQTGIGPVAVRRPKVRDRAGDGCRRCGFEGRTNRPISRLANKKTIATLANSAR